MTVALLIALAALALTVAAAIGRAPLWAAVFLIVVVLLLQLRPRR